MLTLMAIYTFCHKALYYRHRISMNVEGFECCLAEVGWRLEGGKLLSSGCGPNKYLELIKREMKILVG
jgi:hypothetical protein